MANKKKNRLFLEPIPLIDLEYISHDSLHDHILELSSYYTYRLTLYIFYELLLPYVNTEGDIQADFSRLFKGLFNIITSLSNTEKNMRNEIWGKKRENR